MSSDSDSTEFTQAARPDPLKFLHVDYDEEGTVGIRREYANLNRIYAGVEDEDGFMFGLTRNSTVRSTVTKASAFIIDLPMQNTLPKLANCTLKHHIIELETESDGYLTLEKGPDGIFRLQSCRRIAPFLAPFSVPIVRLQRDGELRSNLESLERIATEQNPKATTVQDLLRELDKKGEDGQQRNPIKDPYHFANSNCQHFAAQVWHELSDEPYPNPEAAPILKA